MYKAIKSLCLLFSLCFAINSVVCEENEKGPQIKISTLFFLSKDSPEKIFGKAMVSHKPDEKGVLSLYGKSGKIQDIKEILLKDNEKFSLLSAPTAFSISNFTALICFDNNQEEEKTSVLEVTPILDKDETMRLIIKFSTSTAEQKDAKAEGSTILAIAEKDTSLLIGRKDKDGKEMLVLIEVAVFNAEETR